MSETKSEQARAAGLTGRAIRISTQTPEDFKAPVIVTDPKGELWRATDTPPAQAIRYAPLEVRADSTSDDRTSLTYVETLEAQYQRLYTKTEQQSALIVRLTAQLEALTEAHDQLLTAHEELKKELRVEIERNEQLGIWCAQATDILNKSGE